MRGLFLAALGGVVAVAAVHAGDPLRDAQRKLKDMGFYHGEVDGLYGSRTGAAIRRYQLSKNLRVTGELNAQTLASLGIAVPQPAGPATSGSEAVRAAQRALKLLGYYGGPVDGMPSERFARGLRAWQKANGLPASGRLDPATSRALAQP